MKKKIVYEIISLAVFVIIALLLGEILIRIEAHVKDSRIWTPDKYLYAQHIPNASYTNVSYYKEYAAKGRINNWGFIGKDTRLEKPKDAQRIIVLGDSITEAVQVDVDKNYCSLLEESLNRRAGKYEVINAGISDYSPRLEYLYLREKLIYFKPDCLMLQLCANDVYDDDRSKGIDVENLDLPLKRSFIYNHSKLYHYFLRQRVKLVKKFFKQKADKGDSIMDKLFFIRKGNEGLKKRLWANTERYLLKIKGLADANNIRLIIYAMPLEAQISPPGEMSPASQFYFKEKPTDDFDSAVKRFCRENNVEFIDMLQIFRDNKKSGLYYPQDGHLAEEGHRLVADVLYKYMK